MSDTFGLLAEFKNAHDIYHAAEKIRDAGFKKWDTYTPYAVHGLDKAMGMNRSKVPIIVLICGITGFTTGTLISWYMNGYDFPLVVGGKPYWSPIYPFPVMYECTILFSAFGAFFGQFLLNLLPQPYHPVFNNEHFKRATDDGFFVVIETSDPKFDEKGTRALLESLGAFNLSPVSK